MYVILSADLRDDAVSDLGLEYRSICLGLVPRRASLIMSGLPITRCSVSHAAQHSDSDEGTGAYSDCWMIILVAEEALSTDWSINLTSDGPEILTPVGLQMKEE